MFTPEGFKLFSFVVGCKHTRTFALNSVAGIIADYVLGESGVSDSPFPKDFYTKVGMNQDQVELIGEKGNRRFTVTPDSLTLAEKTAQYADSFQQIERVVEQAKYIFPGTLEFLREPKLVFLGAVWQYVKTSTRERKRFKHPSADYLAQRLLKVKFNQFEFPSDTQVKFSFRNRLNEGMFQKEANDYRNVNIGFNNTKINDLWPTENKASQADGAEEQTVATISVDIQHMFDPNQSFNRKMIEAHFAFCSKFIESRFKDLLKDLTFGDEAKKE